MTKCTVSCHSRIFETRVRQERALAHPSARQNPFCPCPEPNHAEQRPRNRDVSCRCARGKMGFLIGVATVSKTSFHEREDSRALFRGGCRIRFVPVGSSVRQQPWHLTMNRVSRAVFPVFLGVLHPIVAKNVVATDWKSAIMPLVVESD